MDSLLSKLNQKYLAYSQVKLLTLLLEKDKIKLQQDLSKYLQNIKNDLEYQDGQFSSDFQTINQHFSSFQYKFTPSNEDIPTYLKKVNENTEQTFLVQINHTIYSKIVFGLWIKDIFRVNDRQDNLIQHLNYEYFRLLNSFEVDLLVDVDRALSLYQSDKILTNSYRFHYLYPIANLLISAIYKPLSKFEVYYALLGNILLENFEKESAIYFFNQTIKINPNYHSGYIGLSDIYKDASDHELSIAYSLKALKILDKYKKYKTKPWFLSVLTDYNSYYAECYYNIAFCYAKQNKFSDATRYIGKAMELKTKFHGYRLDKFSDFNSVNDFIQALHKEFLEKEEVKSKLGALENLSFKDILQTTYNEESIQQLPFINLLTNTSKEKMKTIHFTEAFYADIDSKNYTPLISEYFGILENELRDKLLKKIEAWISQNSVNILTFSRELFKEGRFNIVMLSSYKDILYEENVMGYISNYLSDKKDFLYNTLLPKIDVIKNIRNDAAHGAALSIAGARGTGGAAGLCLSVPQRRG